jgi:hypothetical protein
MIHGFDVVGFSSSRPGDAEIVATTVRWRL